MIYSFEQFMSDLSAGRNVSPWHLHRQGQRVVFPPHQVVDAMSRAYIARDVHILSTLIELAQAYPDRRYTDVLCKIVEDPEPVWGCAEMALDALEDVRDPRSFDALVRVATRADLVWDLDWRKAVDTIADLYGWGMLEFEVVEKALRQIAESGNILSKWAASSLDSIIALKSKRDAGPR